LAAKYTSVANWKRTRDSTHLRLVLGAAAAAHLFNVDDGEDCCEADNLLDYGMTWSEGPFTCHSAPKGLSCNR